MGRWDDGDSPNDSTGPGDIFRDTTLYRLDRTNKKWSLFLDAEVKSIQYLGYGINMNKPHTVHLLCTDV